MLAAVAEPLLVPGELDDLHRLFEDLTVDAVVLRGHLVVATGHHRAQGPCLAGHRATADTELHLAAGDDVGDREVFGQAQRMPLRNDVEHLPEAQPLGLHRQVLAELDEVRQDLVSLVLEVVLGQPHRVETELVGGPGPFDEVLVAIDDRGVAESASRRRNRRIAGVGHRYRAEEVGVDAHDRDRTPPVQMPAAVPTMVRGSAAPARKPSLSMTIAWAW